MSAAKNPVFLEFLAELKARLRDVRAEQAAPKQQNSKIVTFLRHGQGLHNVAELEQGFTWTLPDLKRTRPELVDPKLTPKGCKEARAVSEWSAATLPGHAEVLFVSPMQRTLETATFGMQVLKHVVPWIACEDLREVCQEHICDLRLPLSATAKRSEFAHVDFAAVPDEDLLFDCNDGHGETFADVANRALRFVKMLLNCTHSRIVVVTHSCFLFVLFNVVLQCADEDEEELKSFFTTCEHRTVEIQADMETCVSAFVPARAESLYQRQWASLRFTTRLLQSMNSSVSETSA